jgi:hypothetical protein
MSAVMLEPTTDPLTAVRERLTTLRADLAKIESERTRCREQIAQNQKVIDAVPMAQQALTDLHARKASGEHVTEKQVATAEENLRNASLMGERAGFAIQGIRAADRRFEEQQAPILQQIAVARHVAKQLLEDVLRKRAEESIAEYRRDAESFVATAHARHHSVINSIALTAQKLGLGDVSAIPCPPSGLPEFISTGTSRQPFAVFSIDARPAIAAAMVKVSEELRLMVEGLL